MILLKLCLQNVVKVDFLDSGNQLLDERGLDSEDFAEYVHVFGVHAAHGHSNWYVGMSCDVQRSRMW